MKNKSGNDLLKKVLNSVAKNPGTLFQWINIQCLKFNGFLFSKPD
jgi:hypothetical protein